MKKQLLILALALGFSFAGFSQSPSVRISSVIPESIVAGTSLKITYQYSADKDTNIYCGINLQDDWTWVSFLGGQGKRVAAGKDVEGTLEIFIPRNTKPSIDLKDKFNYKIHIEMKSLPDYTWLAGDYPATPLNIVAPNK